MQTIYEATLAEILPESIGGDEKFQAIAQALDPLLKKFASDTKLAMHLPRLDELSGTILDLLAEQFHVDNFDSINLSDDQKKFFIRHSIAHHRRKGTIAAVEDVVNQFFKSAQVQELGDYLFKIKTKEYLSTPDAFQTFVRMLFDAKNVRSWLASIDIDLSPPPMNIHAGNLLIEDGITNVGLRRPKDSLAQVHAGNLLVVNGNVRVGLRRLKSSRTPVKVGCPLVITGDILFDSKDRPQLLSILENPVADLAIADCPIARGDNLFVPPDFDLLKLFFKYPTGIRRSITLKNPRQDVTKQEIKVVTDYAVEHDLLLDKDDESSIQAPKATLIKKVFTTLI